VHEGRGLADGRDLDARLLDLADALARRELRIEPDLDLVDLETPASSASRTARSTRSRASR
jgi:hypothetical protein